jgi:hypothetical protein
MDVSLLEENVAIVSVKDLFWAVEHIDFCSRKDRFGVDVHERLLYAEFAENEKLKRFLKTMKSKDKLKDLDLKIHWLQPEDHLEAQDYDGYTDPQLEAALVERAAVWEGLQAAKAAENLKIRLMSLDKKLVMVQPYEHTELLDYAEYTSTQLEAALVARAASLDNVQSEFRVQAEKYLAEKDLRYRKELEQKAATTRAMTAMGAAPKKRKPSAAVLRKQSQMEAFAKRKREGKP